jgi:4,5-DOPA dioxygenase extradiol
MTHLDRRRFLIQAFGLGAGIPLAAARWGWALAALEEKGDRQMPSQTPVPGRMPVLFVGHGSPMNAIEDNVWSRGFHDLATLLPRPKAILSVSAHWFLAGTLLTGDPHPKTIHDFGGFPQELHEMQYPAPGDAALAKRVSWLLADERALVTSEWGLDHGTWTVLHHLRPDADCPVVQLSIDDRLPPAEHLAIGRRLTALRDEGVLIMGSGNLTHNLGYAFQSSQRGDLSTPDWASRFDSEVARAVEQHDGDALATMVETEDGRMAHPTLDHYLPILYAIGAAGREDAVRFPITGFDLGSLSMRAVIFG